MYSHCSLNSQPNLHKSLAVVLCLTNYLFIPFDTQVKHSIDKLDWLNLVAYVLIEQLFLASFRRLDYHFVGYIPAVAILTQIWLRKDEFAFFQAQDMELMFPVRIDLTSAGNRIFGRELMG